MNSKSNIEFDFETFQDAAENDQERFEALRSELIEQLIESAPEKNQQRLRCLQWRIDQERKLSRTPMGACLNISKMMWKNVLGEGGLRERFAELGELLKGDSGQTSFDEKATNVVQFNVEAERA